MARINTFRTQNPFGSARHFVTVRNPGQLPAATWCVRNGEPCAAQPTLTMGAVVSFAIKVVAASNLSIKTVVQIAACIAVWHQLVIS